MAPYRNVHYWLSDFHSSCKAVGKEEIFNQCHAKLRNVIERAFGIVKTHFPILKRMVNLFVYYSNKNCHVMLLHSQISLKNLNCE